MKQPLLLIAIAFTYSIKAQNLQLLQNSGFETGTEQAAQLPKFWDCQPINKTTIYRDSFTVHSGKYALKMYCADAKTALSSCKQKCPIPLPSAQRIKVSCWVRTLDCAKGMGIECAQLDSEGKELSFTNSYLQDSKLKGTHEWTKVELPMLLNPATKQLEINNYFNGTGTVWLDDVLVETIANNLKTAPIITAYMDSLVKFVKENALVSDSINWTVLTQQLTSFAKGMQTYREAELLANYVINELHLHGDNHSLFMSRAKTKQLGNSDIMGAGRKVTTKYLGEGVGYISMPGFASMSDSIRVAFASETQQLIKKLDTENSICSWVVDLRDDNGGSAPPMILGLGPILENGVYDLQYYKGDTTAMVYENGGLSSIYNGKKEKAFMQVPNAYSLRKEHVPVAVLIGDHCGSSGENTALAFVGRHDTKLFGQPSAGYTKGNQGFTLPDSSMIFISAGISSDRNGKLYPERIVPDEQVDQTKNNQTDLTLDRAKKWLITMGKCK